MFKFYLLIKQIMVKYMIIFLIIGMVKLNSKSQ
jgi:hypothetical protein